jgi:hypothetical protein
MRTSLRRTAVATAATVLSGLSLVPLSASPALAATTTEIQFYVNDSDSDGLYGLYERSTPTGTPTRLVGDDGSAVSVESVVASQDGSRFVELEYGLDANGDPSRERVVVYDVRGTGSRRVVSDVDANAYALFSPALSPDGSTVVWSVASYSTGALSLVKAPATGGTATAVPGSTDLIGVVFADATTLLVKDANTQNWLSMPLAGGTRTLVSALGTAASQPVANASSLAWAVDTTTGTASTSDLEVASLTVTSGVASVGTPTTVATGLENDSPAFSNDGTNLYFVKWDGDVGAGDVYTAPVNGSSTAGTKVDGSSIGDVLYQAIGAADSVAPAAPTANPFVLNGTSVGLSWAPASDTDLAGVYVRRYLGATLKAKVFVAKPATSYTDTGLVLASTYSYVLTSVDRSGNESATAERTLTAVQAKPFVYSPSSIKYSRAPFGVSFSASGEPSNVLWTVQYRTNGGAWTPWVSGVAGTSRYFGSAATTGVAATTSTPGNTYAFRVSAADGWGNLTPTVISTGAVVPFDQTKAVFSGGTNYAVSAAWLGGYRQLKVKGNYAAVYLVGNQVSIIGTKCSACGAFDLYDNGKLIRTVDTYRSSTATRAVLFQINYGSSAGHNYKLVVRGTAGRPSVILDGFGMRR